MGTRYSSGFTIIETVLFLSVTGLLVLGVLIGTGSAINNQRYRDATETFKSLMQEQYTAIESVRNGRDNIWGCESSGAQPIAGGTEIRGQSDCVIVGRYMQIRSDDITIYSVLARKTNPTMPTNDILAMANNYVYGVSTAEVISTNMEWGTEIAWPESGSGGRQDTMPRDIGVLFMRSPESGAIYTFTNDVIPAKGEVIAPANINTMITASAQGERTLCIKVNGAIGYKVGDAALYISANSSGPSAIETRSNDTARTLVGSGAPQC